jgi:hypothetical protein
VSLLSRFQLQFPPAVRHRHPPPGNNKKPPWPLGWSRISSFPWKVYPGQR